MDRPQPVGGALKFAGFRHMLERLVMRMAFRTDLGTTTGSV
jgi:hypothetical protein